MSQSYEDDRDASRQSDLAVMDADEYKQSRLLKRVLDMQERVLEQMNAAREAYITGSVQADGRNIWVYNVVEDYAISVYGLLNEVEGGVDAITWDRYFDEDQALGVVEYDDSGPVIIDSVGDFLEQPEVDYEQWEVVVEHRNAGDEVQRRTNTVTVPKRASKRAYMVINEYLAEEHGIEISFETPEIDVHETEPI